MVCSPSKQNSFIIQIKRSPECREGQNKVPQSSRPDENRSLAHVVGGTNWAENDYSPVGEQFFSIKDRIAEGST